MLPVAMRPPIPAPPADATAAATVAVYGAGGVERRRDLVAAEEPLEIRVVPEVAGHRVRHSVAVTMRTPGHDDELAVGFLLSEGVVPGRAGVASVAHCAAQEGTDRNIVEVVLHPDLPFDAARFTRNVYTTSSCGVCGKTSIDLVRGLCAERPRGSTRLAPALLRRLPRALREAQAVFSRTGGLHAAGLFDATGRLLLLREDVGRHNAVDKVVGAQLLAGELPAADRVLLVSGRASFELVQKTAAAGIPTLAAIGAPSSLAVELAGELGLTLVGFLGETRFNVYSGEERIG
jgi:FdhD protein